jgi:hypothetical protein
MSKVFKHLLAVFVVILMYGIYSSILTGICEALSWESKDYAAMITGLLLAYSMMWLEKKNEELDK